MSTKLAIELLTESHNDLMSFLAGLGLLGNEAAINELKTAFDAAFQTFLDDYDDLKTTVAVSSSQVENVGESLELAREYHRIEAERLHNLLVQKTALVKEIEIFEEQKESIEKFSDEEKLVIQGKVDEIKQDIFDTEEEISQLRKNANSNEQQIYVLERELNAHILRYSLQKELLSLSGLDTAQKLESVKLQIQQQSEDLDVLNNQDIVEQQTIVNAANNKLSELQTKLDELQETKTSAELDLSEFETEYGYLLGSDVTEFLDWNVDENTPEVVKLWQQYLAVEGEEIVSERLISLQSQAASEEAVTIALNKDNIEGYVILGAEIAEEIEGLSAIWLDNLQESHQLTVDVWNLSEKRSQAVDELGTYLEDNLADPQGEYILDKIQLQEAIARQEAQVNYADALGQSVDSLEEAIAVLQTQVDQYKIVSVKLDHISQLTSLEKQYATLGSQASQALRLQLINVLNKEITNKTQDLIIEIDLSNDQQEQWLETNLQKYIQQKQSNILGSSPNQDQSISNLQNLRVETAYLTLQAEQNPNKLQSYLTEYFSPIGDGTFKELINTTMQNGSFSPDSNGYDRGEFADVNGDGRQDYVVVWNNGGKRAIATFLANANGTFNELINTTMQNGNFSGDPWGYDRGKFADVNGDGKQDYVVVWNNGGKRAIATFLANADGTFKELINTTMQNGSFS
ncbi:FG-GAP-like repeat-containing protein, partial [Crocosphaera sp. XPORK-15E]|uniref:FG-GAP-like repeat-containing protein n=1 Tax=Crocosphaera sp. XPORK-15E TaxID=3110247 RepID=UPI002B1EB647